MHNVFPNDDIGARLYARLYGPAITRREVRSIVSQSMDPDVATSALTGFAVVVSNSHDAATPM